MCDADQFHCKNVPEYYDDDPCIPNDWVNDGEEDCEDGSDETKGLLSIVYTCLKIEQMTLKSLIVIYSNHLDLLERLLINIAGLMLDVLLVVGNI